MLDAKKDVDLDSTSYKTEVIESSKIRSPKRAYLTTKRVADVVVSTVALITLSPIFLLVWLMNLLDKSNQGPLFYGQIRVGYHGRKFKMYKFRSMVVDADKKLHDDKKLYATYVSNNYKLQPEDDPRITRVGQFIRKTSIDEIPQFINILKGDMSLIGPRPVVEEELVQYDTKKLLSVKPGAMGLWQASGRSQIGYPQRAEIEMKYIDHASISLDLQILGKNLVNIFSRKGAY